MLWENPFCDVFMWLCVGVFVSMCMCLHASAILRLSGTHLINKIPARACTFLLLPVDYANVGERQYHNT